MKNRSIYFLLFFFIACESPQPEGDSAARQPVDFVDPFIGTGGHGHTYPGVSRPFGMVQLSPDNGTEGWDWCSGYHYSDTIIAGFSHLHLSGTGIGDLYDISFMPGIRQSERDSLLGYFCHQNEKAEPGYYQVYLNNYDINVELAATERVGLQQYTFPQSDNAIVDIDLGFSINWDEPVTTYLQVHNDSTISGFRKSTGWARNQWVYFYSVFSKPFNKVELSNGKQTSRDSIGGKSVKGSFYYQTAEEEKILIKTGISSASVAGAKAAIEQEMNDWDFAEVRQETNEVWNENLSVIRLKDADEEKATIFYTGLYHSMLAPALYSDALGEYKGVDTTIHKAEGYNRYTVFSLWDTFRAAHPLFTITQPERVSDFIRSMLAFYDEYGLLPVWALHGSETNTMTGYHAVPVIAEAYLKGYRDFDIEKAYEAMKASAMQDIRSTDLYRKYNYVPADLDGWSVTKTLEYAYDDWCIAQIAQLLGKEEDYDYFISRSQYYKNLFDPGTGFMRGKTSEGNWVAPFDPYYSEHGFEGMYIEGTAWQHSFFVPQDVEGLVDLYGSKRVFTNKLDTLFTTESVLRGENVSLDITGLIGQYAHGNEPSHHIAYLYNYAGQPWKTQYWTSYIMDSLYTSQIDGLSGNEDCGQMSAWYIFSCLGFYPVNPVSLTYQIGSPQFAEISIQVAGGKEFEVTTESLEPDNPYIQSATLNGEPLERSYLRHSEIMAGGNLHFVMGPEPNEDLW